MCHRESFNVHFIIARLRVLLEVFLKVLLKVSCFALKREAIAATAGTFGIWVFDFEIRPHKVGDVIEL